MPLDQEVGCLDSVLLENLTEDSFIGNLHQRYKRDNIYVIHLSIIHHISHSNKHIFFIFCNFFTHIHADLYWHIFGVSESVSTVELVFIRCG